MLRFCLEKNESRICFGSYSLSRHERIDYEVLWVAPEYKWWAVDLGMMRHIKRSFWKGYPEFYNVITEIDYALFDEYLWWAGAPYKKRSGKAYYSLSQRFGCPRSVAE